MNIIVNIVTSVICLPWPGIVLMSPMMVASKDFASSKYSVFMAMLFLIYPSLVFLLLNATGFSFYGTNPVWWAAAVFAAGMFVSLAYRLPQQLYNLYKGIPNKGYFTGKNNVYLNGQLIKGADVSTFIRYDYREFYSKDKNHVYYNTQRLPDADPSTFRPLPHDDTRNYWHDRKYAYYRWMRIPGADGATFRYLGGQYACDKTHVYYENKMLPDADVVTFRPMSGHVGRDACRVFIHALPADNVQDVSNFETVMLENQWFGRDKKQIYSIRYTLPYPLLPFPEADPDTFEVLDEYYAKDKNRVYHYRYSSDRITILEEANPATFQVYFDSEKNTDAADGVNFYRNGILYSEKHTF